MIDAGVETVHEMRGALSATIKGLEPYINPLTVKARLQPRSVPDRPNTCRDADDHHESDHSRHSVRQGRHPARLRQELGAGESRTGPHRRRRRCRRWPRRLLCRRRHGSGQRLCHARQPAGRRQYVEIATGMVEAGAPYTVEALREKLDDLFANSAALAVPVTDLGAFFANLHAKGYRLGVASSDNERSIRETARAFRFRWLSRLRRRL